MSFTFVTSYIQFDESKNDFYYNHFTKLAEMGFPIFVFIDSNLQDKLKDSKKYENVTYKLIDWSTLPYKKHITNKYIAENNITLEKPNKLTETKDTLDFLIMMNSKPYFLSEAKRITKGEYEQYVWIDFGILKITDDLDHFKRNFSKLKKYNKIVIPGGFKEKKQLNETELMVQIYWRFLGGLIICPKDLIDNFHEDHNNEFYKLLENNKITWEVNIWANLESNGYIHYYRADHNKTMFGFYDKKVILISMIKNEEKIIRRCIDSVLNICDAFCVSDTMSTDNTIQIVQNYINELSLKNKPGKLYQNSWSNFGSNRTISYNNTVDFCNELGWDKEFTYGLLLDADMKLVVQSGFNKETLVQNGYKIIQDNGNLDYHNTRFVRLNGTWKCVGVTHEYWDGPDLGLFNKNQIYIHDIGDGGCKDDKFQRDMKLLVKGIEDEPNNGRYHFYLAQTCKDMGKYKDAIKLYKKRIQIGGWDEEVWYSHYMIAKCWLALGNIPKTEMWANKAYEYRKSRAEPIYMLCNLFRDKGQNFKSHHYYKLGKSIRGGEHDSLFVEKAVYKYLFDYELTINHFWLFPYDKVDGLKHIINYLNNYNHSESNVYSNIDHYVERLINLGSFKLLDQPILDNYCASSPSIIEYNNKLLVNLRYVNYRIQPDGSYMMYDNNTFNHANNVKTKNALIYLDKEYNAVTNPLLFDNTITDIPKLDVGIKGLEDLRLFTFKDKVYYTATTREYSYKQDTNRICMGEYDINNLKYLNNKVLYPPTETTCEKNWIPINHKNEKILFIYNWHPLQIGELDDANKLNIKIIHNTPSFFKNYRGSTGLSEYNNQLWCITHGVKYSTPRKYYHQFVALDKDTYKPIKYSIPFYFDQYKIEYTVGLLIKDDEVIILFSQNDKDPGILSIKINKLNKYMINI